MSPIKTQIAVKLLLEFDIKNEKWKHQDSYQLSTK